MLTFCYRVEHRYHGHGPYVVAPMHHKDKLSYDAKSYLMDNIDWKRQPVPDIRLDADEFCGFDSLESLKEWFNEFVDVLSKANYEIRVFIVNKAHIRYANCQIVFKRYKAKRYCVLPITEIA